MDGLLVDIILPSLFSMCYEGILSFRVPYKKELLSGFVHLCDFVRDPQGPISWALVFTIHTILTSIFVTQESNQYTLLAESACFAFDDYFERLASVEQAVNCTIPRRPPVWDETLEALPSLKRLVTLPIERPREHEMLAIWNPYCAGTFLTYLAFHGNLEAGAMLVDETGQLKMTLHLFNALTQADAIPWGQIALLEGISERFKNCRAIWDVSPSEKGKHQEQWWMSIGMPARTAQELSALEPLSPRLTDMKRDRRLIEVDQLSKSYRRVCLHDFQGASDVSLVAKQEVNDLFHEHFVRAYEATRSMADESVLLRTNLIGLGHYLNEFCIHLFNKMGWMSLVERKVAERK
jgi:hypothetical protein